MLTDLCVVCGGSFSFAIHALSQSIYPPSLLHVRSLAETVYLTFCLTVTVTVGGLVEVSTEPEYERVSLLNILIITFANKIIFIWRLSVCLPACLSVSNFTQKLLIY